MRFFVFFVFLAREEYIYIYIVLQTSARVKFRSPDFVIKIGWKYKPSGMETVITYI